MAKPNTLAQPISFDAAQCGGCQPIVIAVQDLCPGIPNPYFGGNPVDSWEKSAGLTQVANDPTRFTGAQAVSHTVGQDGLTIAAGEYNLSWSLTNNDVGMLSAQAVFSNADLSSSFSVVLSTLVGVGTVTGTEQITLVGDQTWNITIAVRQQNGPPAPVMLDTTFNSFILCPVGYEQDFCFQLPLFPTGDELLQETDQAVGFATDFLLAAGYNSNVDTTGPTCATPPFDSNTLVIDATGSPVSGDGDYFVEIDLGDVNIIYGANPDTDQSGELLFKSIDGAEESQIEFTNGDANSTLFYLTSNVWNSGDEPSLWIAANYECDGTDLKQEWDITVNTYSFTPAFYESTFTAADDTFYRLTFDLSKTTHARVIVSDSAAAVIFDSETYGPTFNKIFQTGTLPSTTVTVRFQITDATEWPNTDWNDEVLTNVQLYEMCKWNATIETLEEVNVDTLTETHATADELTSTVSYNKNVQYCIDTGAIDPGCYQFRIINDCDSNEFYTSNCVRICDSDCGTNSIIAWDHGNIKFVGDGCLDYYNYSYIPYFYVKTDLQDLTVDEERVVYADAAYYLQNPRTAQRAIQTLQVWPLPGFMRRAFAMAATDVFMINGIEYRKVDDEAFTPGFNAVADAPMRVLVTKVGDFTLSKNI